MKLQTCFGNILDIFGLKTHFWHILGTFNFLVSKICPYPHRAPAPSAPSLFLFSPHPTLACVQIRHEFVTKADLLNMILAMHLYFYHQFRNFPSTTYNVESLAQFWELINAWTIASRAVSSAFHRSTHGIYTKITGESITFLFLFINHYETRRNILCPFGSLSQFLSHLFGRVGGIGIILGNEKGPSQRSRDLIRAALCYALLDNFSQGQLAGLYVLFFRRGQQTD